MREYSEMVVEEEWKEVWDEALWVLVNKGSWRGNDHQGRT